MSEEEVERVAKAIYEADDPWSEAFPWPNMGSKEQSADNYRRIAQAAIKALLYRAAKDSPYQRGRSAFYRDGSKNPYMIETPLGKEWQAGYDDEKASFESDPVIAEAVERNG